MYKLYIYYKLYLNLQLIKYSINNLIIEVKFLSFQQYSPDLLYRKLQRILPKG